MNEQGFTLIEVLIAITIAGIILGTVFTFFDLSFSTWQRFDSSSWQQQWRVFSTSLTRDLHHTFFSTIYSDNKFVGNAQEIKWLILEEGGLKKVIYSFNSTQNQLVREVTSDKNQESNQINFFSDINLTQVRFSFYDSENEYWKDNWSYQSQERLPLAVKVEIISQEVELPPLIIDLYINKEY